MLEQYKDFCISGHSIPGYPDGPTLALAYYISVSTTQWLGVPKLDVHNFALEDRELAELIGLELVRLIVHTCYPALMRTRQEIVQRERRQTSKSRYRR